MVLLSNDGPYWVICLGYDWVIYWVIYWVRVAEVFSSKLRLAIEKIVKKYRRKKRHDEKVAAPKFSDDG